MSYLRIVSLLLIVLGPNSLAAAATSDDLDPRVLLEQTTDHTGRCRKGSGEAGGSDSCCGTSFQAMPGSVGSRGARNLCFGSQSIGAISTGAVSQGAAQVMPPLPLISAQGSPGASGASPVASYFSSGGSTGDSFSQGIFSGGGGGGGGGQNVGAPGPVAGAGLPFLLVAGAYALVRRRRARA